jgi:DHA1 family bicyclomycin/chloramphenicol resistance-like MFS transporter
MTVALGPLALDAYLPAFPAIADALDVTLADVGLSLSAYVTTLGLAQLVGGPLSDRYGRRGILVFGLAVFAVAALFVASAQTLGELLGWRIVQGIGGAFCAVSVPAIVRDQSHGQDAARLFGLIGLVMFVAPALAPSLGTLLLVVSDWPAIFYVLSVYAVLLGVVLNFLLFRRLSGPAPVSTPVATLLTNYLLVLRHPLTMRFIGIQALAFSIVMIFITHASFIYQEWFGLSEVGFSALFAGNIAAMASLNLLNRRLLRRFESVVILRALVILQCVGIFGVMLSALLGAPWWGFAAFVIASVGCMGAIVPNNMANALEYFPHLGGTASALLGGTQFTIAGIISAISASIGAQTLTPIVVMMMAGSVGAVLLVINAPGAVRRERESALHRPN